METYKNTRAPFTGPVITTSVHVTDSVEYDMATLDTGSASIPRLGVQDDSVKVTLFFETTEQIERLRDALSAYLAETSVVR